MIPFLFTAAALTGLALLFLWRALRPVPEAMSRPQCNAGVLRQLAAELERDRALGLVASDDYAVARLELEQRVLAETAPVAVAVCAPPMRRTAILAGVALPLAAAALYALLGTPQALFRDNAPSVPVDAADAESVQSLALRRHLAGAPRDGRAWVLLARAQMAQGQFTEAADAYRQALAVSPAKIARDPLVLCEAADAIALTRDRILSGEPAALIERALALDPMHPRALEMAGGAAFEARDFARASTLWRQLLAQLPESAPEHVQLVAALARIEPLARFSLAGTSAPAR